MAYYPKSQIKTNLYTSGLEYVTANGTVYTGYYYEISTGKKYTGKNPQDIPTEELFPYQTDLNLDQGDPGDYQVGPGFDFTDPDPQVAEQWQIHQNVFSEYGATIKTGVQLTKLPYYIPPQPTEGDYQIGEFTRYFCKKTNEIIYIEIDKDQYNKSFAQDNDILWSLYKPFKLPWDISGDKNQVVQTNRNMVELLMVREGLPYFDQYLRYNFSKFYK